MAAPVAAGSLGGAQTFLIPFLNLSTNSPGDCYIAEDLTSQHFFIGFVTGSDKFAFTGALTAVPAALDGRTGGRCTFAGEFSE